MVYTIGTFEGPFRWLQRLAVKVGLWKPQEFVYGSRNIQLQRGGKTFYAENVYAKIGKQFRIADILRVGESLYGEIVGPGIQKGYDYGFVQPNYGFFAYDVKVDGLYLDPPEFREWCAVRGYSLCSCAL